MSETTADTATTDAPDNTPEAPTDTVDLAAEVEKWKAQARKHEERAKANAKAAKELDELRASTMSDQEKAVADALAQGRAEALAESAGRLVDAEIRVKAAGRLGDEALELLTASLDRSKFLDADGSVDTAAVAAFVEGITPAPQPDPTPPGFPPAPDLGQGPRGDALALNGDPLLQSLKSAVGAT